MNLADARLVLRPRSAADVLDLAAPFCLRAWRLTLPLSAVVLGPALAACLLARHTLQWRWPLVWALAGVLGAVCQAPFVVAFGDLLFRPPRELRLRAILGRSLRRQPSLLLNYVVTTVIHVVGLVLLVLPLFTLTQFLVTPEAVCLEGMGPFAALQRSSRAVRSRGVAAFGIVCVLGLLPVAGLFGGELIGQTVVAGILQFGTPFGELTTSGGSVFALLGFFLMIPLVASARFLAYVDLRTRKEGWDIQLKFMAIAAADQDARHEAA